MSTNSKIEWTETTWNPIAGCSLVSPGCTNCYAMGDAHRLGELIGQAKYKGLTCVVNGKPVWTGEVRVWEKALLDPLKWRKPKRVFVNSMSDLFADGVADATIDRVFAVMALAPQHTFQVLTKRPERMRSYLRATGAVNRILEAACHRVDIVDGADLACEYHAGHDDVLPLPNVWLGVSVEDQRRADERIPILLDTPAAVRWISAEPLLGPVDLERICLVPKQPGSVRAGIHLDCVAGRYLESGMPYTGEWDVTQPPPPDTEQRRLDWVVVGGESGPDARPMQIEWARQMRDQCAQAGVAFFFKQWGEHWPAEKTSIGKDGEVWRTSPSGVASWFFDELGKTDAPQVRMLRLGKKKTGRTLDGRTYDEYPQVRRDRS